MESNDQTGNTSIFGIQSTEGVRAAESGGKWPNALTFEDKWQSALNEAPQN